MGKALSYTLDNWQPLTVFANNSQVPLDNNASERALRIIALAEKIIYLSKPKSAAKIWLGSTR
jgi:hypothetical protein